MYFSYAIVEFNERCNPCFDFLVGSLENEFLGDVEYLLYLDCDAIEVYLFCCAPSHSENREGCVREPHFLQCQSNVYHAICWDAVPDIQCQ